MFPIGHRWEHYHKVSLIGDAAHLMPPYTGEGINVAVEDAVELAQAFIRSAETKDLQNSGHKRQNLQRRDVFMSNIRAGALVLEQGANFFTPGAPHSTIHTWLRNNAMGTGAIWA